jgi:5-methylthioadenosine/S-adenosylhomocysteine deaminase
MRCLVAVVPASLFPLTATQKDIRTRMWTIASCVALALISTTTFSQSPKLVVRNATIMTMAEGQKTPIAGYISVAADGTILAVAAGEPPASLHAAKIIDAHGDYMIPGFISAHSHIWQAAYRGLAEDKTTPPWGKDLYGQHAMHALPEDVYWFCLYGSLDHLQHGITTAFDFTLNRGSISNEDNGYEKAQFRAKMDSGIRFEHAYNPGNTSIAGTVVTNPAAATNDTFDQARTRLKAFLDWTDVQPKSSKFLKVMLSGAVAGDQPYGAAALMKEFHLGNETHFLEAPDNEGQLRASFGTMLASGLLSHDLFFGHFVHTDDYILQETAKAGAGMSWQPLSNGRLAAGVADIPKYLKMGIRVGMGVDGEASADLADPFENMRTGLYAVRDKYEDAGIMSPYEVLYLHTMGSADVMLVKDKVGSLEPGKFADFLLINPARLGVALEDPYANLVFVAGERDIDSVYIGGEMEVDHDKVLHQDLPKVQAEAYKRVVTLK